MILLYFPKSSLIILYFPNSSILTTAQLKKNTLWQMHIAAQLAHGLTYLHTKRKDDKRAIVHRDISARNVLLSGNINQSCAPPTANPYTLNLDPYTLNLDSYTLNLDPYTPNS